MPLVGFAIYLASAFAQQATLALYAKPVSDSYPTTNDAFFHDKML